MELDVRGFRSSRAVSLRPGRMCCGVVGQSACVASKRCPEATVIRHTAISEERSWLIRRWPNERTAYASSQRSFSTVSGSPSCWAR